jgi:GMP synthase-like glutamine amidotransferase
MPIMNLGILNCDRVSDVFARHGQYPDMFATLLQSIAPQMTFTVFNVIDEELPKDIHAADAYLITGSKYSVNDNYPWITSLEDFVRSLYATSKKVIGICFGHQLIAKVFGGKVIQSPKGWGLGVLQNQIVQPKEWMHPPRPHFNLLASHQDQVEILPFEAQLLASSEFCPNNMMQIGNTILSLQGHPEFTKAYAKELMQSREHIIAKEVLTRGLQSLEREHEYALIAQWMIQFLD